MTRTPHAPDLELILHTGLNPYTDHTPDLYTRLKLDTYPKSELDLHTKLNLTPDPAPNPH